MKSRRKKKTSPHPMWPMLVIALLHETNSVQATTIVAVMTDATVSIAADSKVTLLRGQDAGVRVCKIHQCGRLVVALESRIGWGEGFRTDSVLDGRCRATARESGLGHVQSLTGFLKEQLGRHIQAHPAEVRDDGKPDPFVSIWFIGFDGQKPFVARRTFVVHLDGAVEVKPEDRFAYPNRRVVLAEGGVLADYESHPEYASMTDQFLLQTLIDDQAKLTPGTGGPVDIVRVTSAGAEWIQKKDECAEIEGDLKMPLRTIVPFITPAPRAPLNLEPGPPRR